MVPQEQWQNKDSWKEDWQRRRKNGKTVWGFALIAVGLFIMLRMFGLVPHFSFHFGWPIILVIIGLIIGARSNFRNNAWWILLLIGGTHLLLPYFPYIGNVPTQRVLWPALLIMAGVFVILRKGDDRWDSKWKHNRNLNLMTTDADMVNIDVTFGARKEVVTSRSFKGGVIRSTFSGVELNLAGAEAGTTPMILEVYCSFAGVEIILPSHWELQNEIQPTLGNVEDSRVIRTSDSAGERRVLVLRGSCNFGSVEIKSY
jgi:hypothetical protein